MIAGLDFKSVNGQADLKKRLDLAMKPVNGDKVPGLIWFVGGLSSDTSKCPKICVLGHSCMRNLVTTIGREIVSVKV